jgi:micrococcal nuclease
VSARKFLLLLAVLAVLCASIYYVFLRTPPAPQEQEQADNGDRVLSVYDGDTFTIAIDAGGNAKVRVLGINTAELRPDECYGPEARDAVRALLEGKNVHLTGDMMQGDRDRYNRLLRYVSLPDLPDLGAWLVKNGFARVYEEYPVARTGEYLQLQEQAQQEKRGGWGTCSW